ncbi:Malic acid transport protein [Cyphellophora attinorum]|uniref:Malic acid transport protein n=1 Tax=Cyphellophora attinorum TaxID=1664694 RepID=A0A0N1HLX5_9EURO|nr:Malic acid transport protein [Phialophora attinorum]KPI35645.1 Malic acid transport protein [Phialophora attinorum]
MATGAVAVVLANTPFRFTGLDVIAKIYFILDLVLFVLFNFCIAYRFIRRPKVFLRSLHHPKEALFLGAYWVTIALLLNLTQTYGVPMTGQWLRTAMRILYWIYSGCALCVAVFQYATLFVAERLPVDSAMPAWVFPVYPFLVIGPLAAVITKSQDTTVALVVWVSAIALQGLGFTVAIFMYSIYVQRLMTSSLPEPSSRPGMYISVGPVAYTSAALLNLADQAATVIPAHWLSVDTLAVPDVIRITLILAGCWLWLLGFWFFALTTVAIIAGACSKQKMGFTLQWWGFVFPNAGLVLASINIGKALESEGVKAVTSAMTLILVIGWFCVAIANIRAVLKGKVLWEGMDDDVGMKVD